MNYYNVLGLKNTASQEEIKASYKKLIKKYHPDIYAGDKTFAEKKTAEINVAYEILSNPVTKKEYDDEHFPKYTYTPPQYDFNNKYTNSNHYNYDSTSYNNAKKRYYSSSTYTGTNDSSEHDYSTYANYERKYTDYHRSTTPNSNYSYRDDFSKKIEKRFNNLSKKNQLRVGILVLFIYFFCFLIFLLQLIQAFKANPDYTSKQEDNSYKNYNYSENNNYYESEENSENTNSSDFSTAENFDLSNYFTEEQLKHSYEKYLEAIQSDPETANDPSYQVTYEEYINILEEYLLDSFYIQNSINTTN